MGNPFEELDPDNSDSEDDDDEDFQDANTTAAPAVPDTASSATASFATASSATASTSTGNKQCLFRIGTNTIMLLKGAAAGKKFNEMADRLKGIYKNAAKDVEENDDLNKFYQRLRSLTADQISWMEMVLYPDTVNNAATARHHEHVQVQRREMDARLQLQDEAVQGHGRGRETATQTRKRGLHSLGWHRPSAVCIQTFAVRLHCSLMRLRKRVL